jgi:type IX secretion system PorP/SprF family membrane protein
MKNISSLIAVMLFALTINVKSQDIHFSQFTMTPLQLDPSQAGKFGGDQRIILNYRDQWRSVANPYTTYGLSFDSRLSKKDNFLGGGISIYNDKAGDISMGLLSVNISLAYHAMLTDNSYISGGVQGGFLQRSLDASKLRYDNQYDGLGHNDALNANELISNTSFFEPDFSAGVSYSYGVSTNKVISNNGFDGTKINVGAAVHHVSNAKFSFLSDNNEKQSFRYILHTNTSFGVRSTNMAVQPSGFIAYQQGSFELLVGSYFRYTLKEKSRFTKFSNGAAINFGVHYRAVDAFILSTLIETGSLAFGLSYDFNLSGLTVASNGNGGFELSIRYITPNPFGTRRSQARFI